MPPCIFMMILIAGVSSLQLSSASPDRKAADHSFETIRLSFASVHRHIESLAIEYKAHASVMGKPIYPEGRYVLRTVAAKGSNRYMSTAHVDDQHEAKDDPRFTTAYYTKNWWNVYYPNERLYEISTKFADIRF